MIRQDSVLPKKIDMGTLKNPVEEIALWIYKIVWGVTKERTKPITRIKVLEGFFPYTSQDLFYKGFARAVSEGTIKEIAPAKGRDSGYLKGITVLDIDSLFS